MTQDRKKIVDRLRRIEGQIRGVQRLIEEEAPCVEVLTQVAAVTSAIKKTGAIILTSHMHQCLSASPVKTDREKEELAKAVSRFIDLS